MGVKGSCEMCLLQELASECQALHARHSSSQQRLEMARRENATLQRQLQLAEVESAAPDPATLGSLQLQGQRSNSSGSRPVRSRTLPPASMALVVVMASCTVKQL